MAEMKLVYFQCNGIDENTMRTIAQTIAQACGVEAPAPIANLAAPNAAPVAITHDKQSPDKHAPEEPAVDRPKRGRPKKTKQTEAADDEPRPGKMADKIAELIEQRGPLSSIRLAQLLANGESSVNRSIGHAGDRFRQNDEGCWELNKPAED